ncbi:uncharacterized protein G2W53_030874 [Senna tora]|uniref:Uncharacterized protein n=1 Tax=Senna tora TaxID=362788 RepID=A0A834WB78_9FABA|nr:uncharacterized protein G2W53_030874 [Senna tora]
MGVSLDIEDATWIVTVKVLT